MKSQQWTSSSGSSTLTIWEGIGEEEEGGGGSLPASLSGFWPSSLQSSFWLVGEELTIAPKFTVESLKRQEELVVGGTTNRDLSNVSGNFCSSDYDGMAW